MPLIEETYIDSGQVRYFFRHPFIHDTATQVAVESLYCAGEQEAFWEMHDWLYFNVDQWAYAEDPISNLVERTAPELGLDGTALTTCLQEGRYRELVEDLGDDATARGVTATPTFLINDRLVQGFMPFEQFSQIIEEELQP